MFFGEEGLVWRSPLHLKEFFGELEDENKSKHCFRKGIFCSNFVLNYSLICGFVGTKEVNILFFTLT